jgi:hypothetical protein
MKTRKNPIISCAIALLAVGLSFWCPVAAQSLKNLKTGQHVEVWFGARGCFHKQKHFFIFRGDSVSISEVTEDEAGEMVKKLIGKITLTPKEISAVDRMFVRFRNADSFGSTSTESLSVEVWKGEQQLSKEILVDGNPQWFGPEEGETSLWGLIGRAAQLKKNIKPNKSSHSNPR